MEVKIQETDLHRFVIESNRIEGITRTPLPEEFEASHTFLQLPAITQAALENFVEILQPGAKLRTLPGMNVVVGDHTPPPGGPDIAVRLRQWVENVNYNVSDAGNFGQRDCYAHPYHIQYETIHPFMDGNGRSGRIVWLWMHLRHPRGDRFAIKRGFLHTWYYESLSASRQG